MRARIMLPAAVSRWSEPAAVLGRALWVVLVFLLGSALWSGLGAGPATAP